jgi:probable LLM family oxidoreductase
MPNKLLSNDERPFELGLYTFIDDGTDPLTGKTKSPQQVMADQLEAIELADQTGLDLIAIGEHHRQEYLSSAPVVILAAAAARTKNIRLSTAVTVLSSDDPVRVFQSFSTLDLISGGRAEIMAGRGSFIESFSLFGYDLNDYGDLFEEKLRLLTQLTDNETINWEGQFRSAIKGRIIYPRPVQERIPLWVAVGGSPESSKRAASLGLPMAFAIIGGQPRRFAPFFDLYRHTSREYGFDPGRIPLSVNSHGFIADKSQDAKDQFYPYATVMMNKIGQERGWGPSSRAQLENQSALEGSDFVGSPDEIVEKILFQQEIFKHQRFLIYMGNNAIDHKKMLRAIELFGTKVAPQVRKEIARRNK